MFYIYDLCEEEKHIPSWSVTHVCGGWEYHTCLYLACDIRNSNQHCPSGRLTSSHTVFKTRLTQRACFQTFPLSALGTCFPISKNQPFPCRHLGFTRKPLLCGHLWYSHFVSRNVWAVPWAAASQGLGFHLWTFVPLPQQHLGAQYTKYTKIHLDAQYIWVPNTLNLGKVTSGKKPENILSLLLKFISFCIFSYIDSPIADLIKDVR